MTNDEYLSTGEAAKLLGLSRSTVSRRFDEGALSGKVHPITGERLISAESARQFLKGHTRVDAAGSQIDRLLVLRSDGQDLIGVLQAMATADRRIRMEIRGRGSDALVFCARQATDLLVLDDTATDIACPDIIHALRDVDDGKRLAVLCCLRDRDATQAAQWGADAVLSLDGLNPAALEARLYELLKLTPRIRHDHAAPVQHRRRWPRHELHVPGNIEVYCLRTPNEQSRGSVIVDNISLGGAGLSKVHLDSNSLPAESFRMLLRVDAPLLPDWQAHCQVVRLRVNGEVSAGVQFVKLTRDCRKKILALERARATQSVALGSA